MSVAVHSSPGEGSIVTRVLDRLPQLAERILASGLGSVLPAGSLPEGHFLEVLPAIYGCAHAFLRAVEQGREFTREEVRTFVVPVVERHAEDRLPLRLLVEAVHESARQVLREAVEVSDPAAPGELVEFGDQLLRLLMHINAVVVESYAEVEQSVFNAEREARRALCAALLRGLPAEELAARADIVLADHYSVLALRLRSAEPAAEVANLLTRRRIRLLQQTLDRLSLTATLHTFDGAHGTVLLPGGEPGGVDVTELAAELAQRFGVDVLVAEIAGTARESVPGAARQAAELAELARLLGRPTGGYRIDDLVLEYQLTRPGPARDRLAERIAPLLRSPHLVETLDAHLRHGADRKSAAAEMHVHPNTFSYRLRRIADLTGTDPGEPNGSRLLAAALTVHRLYPTAEGDRMVHPQ
ncbi:PucR family transcriptional regulator [Nocardia terpenica]|uniref:Transcriptional regulator n=1 Tax=Nocardia terpenica TaxID=455432 RepID=A0A164KCD7_9NOCA|nr:PucR family transcriptional regulator [Nocardia terpenica]KZM71254.1 transcriptional regulator [Nocardia terpenica]NQE90385.1 helix-turn-helix domain-containing protein [Nocardia terpenica]